jgi:cytochrome c oxidase assembly protein subunit 15
MVSSGLIDRVDVSHFRLSAHLFIAFLILSMIFWNYLNVKENHIISTPIKKVIPFLFLILIFVQIIIGAFVSGMDAGKIYNSWPFMGTTYFPNDNDFSNLFKLSAFSDPSLVQFIHRNLAYLIGIFYLFIFYKIYINKMVDLYKSINIVGCFILLQVILGILTILFGAQIYIASMHQISSIFLVSSCIYLFYINTNLTYRF